MFYKITRTCNDDVTIILQTSLNRMAATESICVNVW